MSANAWENPLKAQLRAGKAVIGMTITVASADVVVQAGRLGFDFVWIEMEHSPITLETARNMVLATQGIGAVPIVRLPANELWLAKRALDCGALGVAFPFTSTPALAKQAVAACRYPPRGNRGAGPGLPTLRWPAPQGYYDFADDNVLVIPIIEQKEAVDNIEAILDVPGIDVAFIGANDLSHSMGFRGVVTDEVKAAMARVLAAGKARNIPVGRTVQNAADLPGFIAAGFQFFQSVSDLIFIAHGAKPFLAAAGKAPPDLSNRPLY